MRYNKAIYFQKVTTGEYDPNTGNYASPLLTEYMEYAAIGNTSERILNIVYDGIIEGSVTIVIQNHFNRPFDYIRVGEKKYRVDFSRKLETKHVFIASEVQ